MSRPSGAGYDVVVEVDDEVCFWSSEIEGRKEALEGKLIDWLFWYE